MSAPQVIEEDFDAEREYSTWLTLAGWFVRSSRASVDAAIAAPLARIIGIYQCQNELIRIGRLDRPYRNAWDCARRVAVEDAAGWKSLWRGQLTRTIGEFVSAPITAIFQTPLYNWLHPIFERMMSSVSSPMLRYAAATVLGLLSGYPSLLIKSPLSYAQIQLQCDITSSLHTHHRFNGPTDVIDVAYRTGGLSSFATGLGAFLGSVIVERRAKSFVYDLVAPRLVNFSDHSWAAVLVLTAFEAGGVLASWPLNTIRRRMIIASSGAVDRHTGQAAKYDSTYDALIYIYKHEGLSALWSGWHLRLGFVLLDTFVNVAVQNVLSQLFSDPVD